MKVAGYEIGIGHMFYPSMWVLVIEKGEKVSFIPLALVIGIPIASAVAISALWHILG